MNAIRRLVLLAAAGLVTALACGCGPSMKKINGKVTYNGKPVTGGTLLFARVDGTSNPASAQINEDGTYEATVPAGELKVTVDNRELKGEKSAIGGSGAYFQGDETPMGGGSPVARGGPGSGAPQIPQDKLKEAMQGKGAPEQFAVKKKGSYMDIPKKYYTMEQTDLVVTVKGNETVNLELKD